MASLAYYQPEHPGSAGVVKYPENGHDTLSDFVTFVCQEAENTQQLPQVASASDNGEASVVDVAVCYEMCLLSTNLQITEKILVGEL